MRIIIVGAGIAGLASAIALTKWLKETPTITILEIRSQPSTIGGAVGLTPNALRCLHNLGALDDIQKQKIGADIDKIELFSVHSGANIGQIDFVQPNGSGLGDPPLKGLRILRSDLLQALLRVVRSFENVDIQYGRKTVSIVEDTDKVSVSLDDDSIISADVLIGCDGIHSVVRTVFMDKDRKPEYTGIAAVYALANLQNTSTLPWKDTGLCQSQRGSLMCSYYENDRTKQYTAAIMETQDVQSREGWLARGTEHDRIKVEVKQRYSNTSMPCLEQLIDATESWALYPVYKLSARGIWCSSRAILIGDAAHAMPPQGESTGIALEDAILLARIISKHEANPIASAFAAYESMRRPRIDKAYDEATFGWETQKDSGWFAFQMRVWITSAFLWWTSAARLRRYTEDVASLELD